MLKAFLRSLVFAALLLCAGGAAFGQNTGKVGVIFMHGKWAPGTKPLENVRQQLMQAGYLVATPMMPWSNQRQYDKSYEDAMAEIDAAADLLKREGATRIVVGGQSLGANAAIGYGARRSGLMAIVAISPGHIPELSRDPQVTDSISRAKAMVAAGRGGDSDTFMDVNQGEKRMIRMTAAIYLSYWDPQGPAVIPQNASKLTAPLLWVVGADDPMLPRGAAYAFDKAPANPLSRYLPVSGGHFTVVQSIGPQVVDWLNTVRDAK
jgi:dienelactone hydrolase